MRRTLQSIFGVVIVGLVGLVLGRSVAAPPTTQEIKHWGEIDAGAHRIVPQIDFHDTPLEDAIDSLREQTKANIVVKWPKLEEAGIDRRTPITLRLKGLSLQRTLEMICALVDANVGLVVEEDRGVIVVSTLDSDSSKAPVMRLYDVRDLVEAETAWLQKLAGPSASTAATQGSLFGAASPQQAVDELTRIIQDCIAPESWRDAGGTEGAIYDFNGRLVIMQTAENHAKIALLLEQIRKG